MVRLVDWLDRAVESAKEHEHKVSGLLAESKRLLDLGFSEAALLRAFTALEVFTKEVLLESFLDSDLADREARRIFSSGGKNQNKYLGARDGFDALRKLLEQQGLVVGPAGGQSIDEAIEGLAPGTGIIVGNDDDSYDYAHFWKDLDEVRVARNETAHEGNPRSRQEVEKFIGIIDRAVHKFLSMIR